MVSIFFFKYEVLVSSKRQTTIRSGLLFAHLNRIKNEGVLESVSGVDAYTINESIKRRAPSRRRGRSRESRGQQKKEEMPAISRTTVTLIDTIPNVLSAGLVTACGSMEPRPERVSV